MKIQDYDNHELPQESIDNMEDIKTLLNFGKYQPQVVTAIPTFTGRRGEFVILFLNNTGAFFWCLTDNAATWGKIV